MRRICSILPVFSLVFAGSAFAGAALPRVDVSRAVSARAMYGEPPTQSVSSQQSNLLPPETLDVAWSPQPFVENKKVENNNSVVARAATIDSSRVATNDVLLPKRPSGNLWANTTDAPLRMPGKNEFARVDSDFVLPEESLSIKPPSQTLMSALAPRTVVVRPKPEIKEVVKTVVDEDAVAKAYQAGRMAELQRIADKALAANVPAPTRKMVVPAPTPAAPVLEVKSIKMTPLKEEEFAYKDSDDVPLTKLSPAELKRAFKKTYISENKHLSAYKSDDSFDTASNFDSAAILAGVDSSQDFAERDDIRPLEIKMRFRGDDSSLSRDNVMLLSEYAGIVVSNPKRAVQISIPQHMTQSFDGKRLAAQRLAIIEQVLRDTGVSYQKIVPVLTDRDDQAFVLRIISNDVFQTLTNGVGRKTTTTRSLAW